MKKRVLFAALAMAAVGLAGCRNAQDPGPRPETETAVSHVRITGIPEGARIAMVAIDCASPKSRGLASDSGGLYGKDGARYDVSEIADGEATSPLYYGADAMLFLFALLGYPPPIGMAPPIAVPGAIISMVPESGDVTAAYSPGLGTLLSAETGTRTWKNVRFADSVEGRVLTLDWNAAVE